MVDSMTYSVVVCPVNKQTILVSSRRFGKTAHFN